MNANPIAHQYAYLKCVGLCYKTSLRTFQQPTTHIAISGVLQSEKRNSVNTKYFEVTSFLYTQINFTENDAKPVAYN